MPRADRGRAAREANAAAQRRRRERMTEAQRDAERQRNAERYRQRRAAEDEADASEGADGAGTGGELLKAGYCKVVKFFFQLRNKARMFHFPRRVSYPARSEISNAANTCDWF